MGFSERIDTILNEINFFFFSGLIFSCCFFGGVCCATPNSDIIFNIMKEVTLRKKKKKRGVPLHLVAGLTTKQTVSATEHKMSQQSASPEV